MSTITARLAHNWLVKHSTTTRREGHELQPEHDAAVDDTADPLDDVIADEDARHLWRAVSALSSGQRTAVMLHYRQDLSVKDVAGALGVTAGTVKTLLFRARQALRRALSDVSWRTANRSAPPTDEDER
jgi:RNA polymerase sigma-70 factor (ECF subfamily)